MIPVESQIETLLRESGAAEKVERIMRVNGGAEMIRAKVIHPALHFEDDFACLSVALPGPPGKPPVWHLVTSDREVIPHVDLAQHGYTASVLPKIEGQGFTGRWRPDSIHAFRTGAKGDFKRVAARIATMADYLFDAPKSLRVLAAVWIIGTYFYRLFAGFPYLNVTGGMGTAKSKLLEFLAELAFNGVKSESVSCAVLFRLVDALGVTVLFDDLENWNREERGEMVSLVNSGYRKRAQSLRMVGQDRDRIGAFNTYSPKCFAGIRGIGDVTGSRSIEIIMRRGKDVSKMNREVDDLERDLAEARDLLYTLALTRFQDVRKAYEADTAPAFLVGRARQLFRPLFAVGDCIESDAPEFKIRERLEVLAKETHGDGNAMSERTEATLTALRELLGEANERVVYPGEVAECAGIRREDRKEFKGESKAYGAELKRLGFKVGRRTKEGYPYRITMDALNDVLSRYPLPPVLDTLHTPTPVHTPPKSF